MADNEEDYDELEELLETQEDEEAIENDDEDEESEYEFDEEEEDENDDLYERPIDEDDEEEEEYVPIPILNFGVANATARSPPKNLPGPLTNISNKLSGFPPNTLVGGLGAQTALNIPATFGKPILTNAPIPALGTNPIPSPLNTSTLGGTKPFSLNTSTLGGAKPPPLNTSTLGGGLNFNNPVPAKPASPFKLGALGALPATKPTTPIPPPLNTSTLGGGLNFNNPVPPKTSPFKLGALGALPTAKPTNPIPPPLNTSTLGALGGAKPINPIPPPLNTSTLGALGSGLNFNPIIPNPIPPPLNTSTLGALGNGLNFNPINPKPTSPIKPLEPLGSGLNFNPKPISPIKPLEPLGSGLNFNPIIPALNTSGLGPLGGAKKINKPATSPLKLNALGPLGGALNNPPVVKLENLMTNLTLGPSALGTPAKVEQTLPALNLSQPIGGFRPLVQNILPAGPQVNLTMGRRWREELKRVEGESEDVYAKRMEIAQKLEDAVYAGGNRHNDDNIIYFTRLYMNKLLYKTQYDPEVEAQLVKAFEIIQL